MAKNKQETYYAKTADQVLQLERRVEQQDKEINDLKRVIDTLVLELRKTRQVSEQSLRESRRTTKNVQQLTTIMERKR